MELLPQAGEALSSDLLAVDAALDAMPEDLREPVRRLLRAHAQRGPLDTPLPEPEASLPGRIGDWRLGAELGRGGMAVVHAAEPEIPGGVQQGALKLLTVGALAADGRRRFLREQAVLARLSHPRIAALLDAGVLADGTPWLVMQRIDGQRIDIWVRERRLLPRRIVQLSLQLCEAVADVQRSLGELEDARDTLVNADVLLALHGEAAFETRVRAHVALERMRLAVETRELEAIKRYASDVLRLVADGQDEESRRARASAQLQNAYAAIQLGTYDDAQAALDRAKVEIDAIEPEALALRAHLAASRGHLAYVTDRMPEALMHMQAAYAYEERIGNAETASSIGKLGNLSAVSAMLGRLDAAEAYDRKALAIARSVYPEGNVAIARSLHGLADILRQRGRFDEALPLLEEARAIQADAGSEGEVDLVDLVRLRVLVSLDRSDAALTLADALLPRLVARWGEGSREVLLASEQALAAASRQGRRESEASLTRDAEAHLTALGTDGRHSLAQQLRWRLGEVARQRGDAVEARRWLEDAGTLSAEDLARSATPSLRLKALALHLASGAARIAGARELAADAAAAKGASQDALLYAWLAVIEAATRADPALTQDALQRAATLVESHPPSADLRERFERTAASTSAQHGQMSGDPWNVDERSEPKRFDLGATCLLTTATGPHPGRLRRPPRRALGRGPGAAATEATAAPP